MGICFALAVALMVIGLSQQNHIVMGLLILGGLINDSVFWINIVQS